MAHSIVFLALLPIAAALTECQQCCSPGGDCSKASHGAPGVCCGQASAHARNHKHLPANRDIPTLTFSHVCCTL